MKIGVMLPALPDIRWKLARQIGIDYAITKASPELTGLKAPWDFESLRQIKERFEQAGFKLYALEGDQLDMSGIKFGLPGRDEDIEKYCQMLSNMGRLEIPLLCYNFMAGIGWFRTRIDIPERGGALTSGFDIRDIDNNELTARGKITEDQLWNNYKYFIKAVIPAAERAGVKMALHPDDPPISPLRGISRIFISADNFRKAMKIIESPSHGITFCQATFRAMGEDVFQLIEEFGKKGKIFFVHFRDIKGKAECFQETFHDNGSTDMVKALRYYLRHTDLSTLIRPDHTPSMAGESNSNPGYEMQGRLFAVGYMKGIIDSIGIKQ
jgi:mannonate dehydratase